LNLLHNRQVTEFNKYLEQGIPIHLPIEKLSDSDLRDFSLQDSLLFICDLTRADLFKADLTRADLTLANLFEANMTGANLFEANLFKADLTRADLTGSMLLDTVLIKCISSEAIVDTHTDFFNAIIDNPDFLKHLREKGCQNIPNEINNKQELRKELLKKMNMDPNMLDIYLSSSELPES
jgi:uncharacterized protein YjbI with pentapeptide repeats